MRRAITVLVFIVICAVMGVGQRSQRRTAPAPAPTGSVDAAEKAFRELKALEVLTTTDAKDASRNLEAYRRPSKADVDVLKPPNEIVSKYGEFLRHKNTGIIKLNAYEKCAKNGEVISADEDCLKYKIPGGGTAYSFRYDAYRIRRLSDIILQNSVLKTDGLLQQGLMVDLGKVAIEEIGLSSPGFKYLKDFEPAKDLAGLQNADRQLASGIEADGFLYRLGFYARLEHTFGLRSVAFKRAPSSGPNNAKFDEFQLDKRHDVIVVFKVVEVDFAGNVTLVWKELSRRDAPTMKLERES